MHVNMTRRVMWRRPHSRGLAALERDDRLVSGAHGSEGSKAWRHTGADVVEALPILRVRQERSDIPRVQGNWRADLCAGACVWSCGGFRQSLGGTRLGCSADLQT